MEPAGESGESSEENEPNLVENSVEKHENNNIPVIVTNRNVIVEEDSNLKIYVEDKELFSFQEKKVAVKRKSRTKCSNCNVWGHDMSECWYLTTPKVDKDEFGRVVCHKCGFPNHFMKNCLSTD